MDRLERLQAHLRGCDEIATEEKANMGGGNGSIERNETRSVLEYAQDGWAMLTQEVKMTERHGGDLVAKVLKAHDVEFIFCLSGGHISPFLCASENLGIRIIDVRHEVSAVFAADAVGRLTGRPGVAAVTAGPGVTNTVTALKNCAMAQSPLVLLGGAAATGMQGRGALQDIDHMSVLEPICKWTYSCRSVRDIVPTLRRAFKEASSGVPGPVFVELPLDVLYPVTELLPQMGTHKRMRAAELQNGKADKETLERLMVPDETKEAGMSAQAFLDSKRPDAPVFVELPPEKQASGAMSYFFAAMKSRLHAGAHSNPDQDYGPLPVEYPLPSTSDVSKAVDMIRAANKPLLLIGSQATCLGPNGTERLRDAVSSAGIPAFLGGMARGMLGRNHKLHIRQNRGKALKACDLVIMLGVVADFRLDYGRTLPGEKSAKIITANRSAEDLLKNSGIFWKPTLASQSDPCTFFLSVFERLCESESERETLVKRWAPWASDLKQGEYAKEAANEKKSHENALGTGKKAGQVLVNPLDLLQKLEEVLPEDSVLVADGGDFVATASYIVRPRGCLRWLDPGAFGTLGVGPMALAAKLVNPNSEVWLIWGDGSCGYSLLEFDTYTRHKLPIIALVGNDACWTQIEREQVPMFDSAAACQLDYVQYHKAAQALGGEGFEITSPDDDITGIMKQAQEIARQGKPVLINANIGKTDFREGSLSV